MERLRCRSRQALLASGFGVVRRFLHDRWWGGVRRNGEAMEKKPLSIDDLLNVQRPTGLVPLHLSPDGRWLTLSVRPTYQDAAQQGQWLNEEVIGSQVLIADTTTGEVTRPFPEAASSWGGQWSPDGRWLAAYAFVEGAPR